MPSGLKRELLIFLVGIEGRVKMKIDQPKKRIILVGGGGHCKAVIDVIEQTGIYEIAGIVDNGLDLGYKVLGYEVIGKDEDLTALRKVYEYAIVTVGQIKSPKIRIKLFELLKSLDFKLPSIVSPRAYVSKYAKLGDGTVVMHDALINAGAKVGQNCIVNTKALIEHDATIENHCHISTGAIVNGGTVVRKNSFFGSNAMAKEYIEIKANSVIGGGTTLLR